MMPTESTSSRTFVLRVVHELRRDRRNCWMFSGATLVQAIAHGILASCAGLLGQALMGRQLASFSALVDPRDALHHPIFLASVGLGASLVKTAASTFSIYGQKRAVFQVGNAIRHTITAAIVLQGQPPSAAAAS